MISGILLSICVAVAVLSRVLYYNAGRKLDESYIVIAAILDITSSGFALLILASYWNIIP